uniref:POU domain, class 2, transcription factor 1 n=1 Tax=Peromyscus maniculatus bairdii TaxID=230844 RepID=A0A8C8UM94_PERMB
MLDCSDCVLDSRMNNPSETTKSSMESGDGSTGTQTNGLDFQKQPVPVGGAISTAQAQAFLGHLHQVQLAGTSLQAAAQSLNIQSKSSEDSGDPQQPSQPSQQQQQPPPPVQSAIPQTQLMLAGGQITGLTLTPAQQQLLLQQAQAQAQLLAAAVQQHSASQQHSAAGATISASAATPMTQIPLSQPIQIAQDLQQLQQLQQQNLNLQQFVLVHPTTNLQPAQFIISQTPQGQQGLLQAQNLLTQLPQQSQANLLQPQPSITLTSQGDVGLAMGKLYGNDFSQTTISRFEALNLSFKNMCKLKPLLEKWLNDAENLSSDSTASSPSALNSPGLGAEGLNRRRKKRTSIETNIRVALEKSFMEVSELRVGLIMPTLVYCVWCPWRQEEGLRSPGTDGCVLPCWSFPNLNLFSGTTDTTSNNTATVISTAPPASSAVTSPSLSPSPSASASTSEASSASETSTTQTTSTPLPSPLGASQVMVTASGLQTAAAAALQGAAQLPANASLAAMAAAAGLNPGLMAPSQFAAG